MHTYKRNEIIAQEGDNSQTCFILISGKIGILKDRNIITEYTDRGTIFGELSAILNQPRTSTLVALEDSQVIIIEKGIDELIKKHPDITKKLMVSLATRLANTTNALIDKIESDKF